MSDAHDVSKEEGRAPLQPGTAARPGTPDLAAARPEFGPDRLERLIFEARYEAPAGLAARLAAAAQSPESRRRVFWSDVERTARAVLGATAAAAVVAVGLAVAVVAGVPDNARSRSHVDGVAEDSRPDDLTLDQVARLALSQGALERQVGGEIALLGSGER